MEETGNLEENENLTSSLRQFLTCHEPDSNAGSGERLGSVNGNNLDHLDIGAGPLLNGPRNMFPRYPKPIINCYQCFYTIPFLRIRHTLFLKDGPDI